MQEKRLPFPGFSVFSPLSSQGNGLHPLRRAGLPTPPPERGYTFSKDLSLLYHKHPTESTLICNFFFKNCELVPLDEQPLRKFSYFRHFLQFDISEPI
jgi:hypothetical protein